MEYFEVLVAIVTVLAACLFFISIIAYRRERSWRLLFAGIVFAIFLIKGIILSISVFFPDFNGTSDSPAFHLAFDIIILLFLFFAVTWGPKSRKEANSPPENIEEKTKH